MLEIDGEVSCRVKLHRGRSKLPVVHLKRQTNPHTGTTQKFKNENNYGPTFIPSFVSTDNWAYSVIQGPERSGLFKVV